jgi:hypothetical protein
MVQDKRAIFLTGLSGNSSRAFPGSFFGGIRDILTAAVSNDFVHHFGIAGASLRSALSIPDCPAVIGFQPCKLIVQPSRPASSLVGDDSLTGGKVWISKFCNCCHIVVQLLLGTADACIRKPARLLPAKVGRTNVSSPAGTCAKYRQT